MFVTKCNSEMITHVAEAPANHCKTFWIVTYVQDLREENNTSAGSCAFYTCAVSVPFLTGAHIYILNGTDPEADPVRYGLTFEKGSKEYFSVDSKSGNVTLIQELDREVRLSINILF